jgi:hypothetical protein
LSRTLRRNQLVALLAALALACCAALYAAHGLGDRGHEHEHCDLCVHLSGSAGTSASPQVLGHPVLVAHVAAIALPPALPERFPPGLSLPRGPPAMPVS